MTSSSREDRSRSKTARSRLGSSLLRLQRGIERARKDEARVESMFFAWKQKWSSRRDLISHRLEMIEQQLEQLMPAAETETPPPQLVVVGVPTDSDEMTSMVAF